LPGGYSQRSAERRGPDDPDTNQRFMTILPKLRDKTHTARLDETGNISDLGKNPSTHPGFWSQKIDYRFAAEARRGENAAKAPLMLVRPINPLKTCDGDDF
jgi:hypothetical protein